MKSSAIWLGFLCLWTLQTLYHGILVINEDEWEPAKNMQILKKSAEGGLLLCCGFHHLAVGTMITFAEGVLFAVPVARFAEQPEQRMKRAKETERRARWLSLSCFSGVTNAVP